MIWLIGQQHGNEPAGGEAMLALASALATGELAPLLGQGERRDRAARQCRRRGRRQARAGLGRRPNRDHLLLSQPEVRAAARRQCGALPPDVVFDHHEFSVAWRWVEKFNGLQASDVMILEATNPSIPKALTDIARSLYRPALEAAIDKQGLSSFDYVTTDPTMADKRVSLGGTAPGIARNTFGLRGAVSYLIETRGVGIGLESYQRRVVDALPAGQGGARGERGGSRGPAAPPRGGARRAPLPIAPISSSRTRKASARSTCR